MLVFFIYLTIGGILLSGLLIGRNEEIFDKDLRRSMKKDFGDRYDPDLTFLVFAMIVSAGMILFWLPVVIWAIIFGAIRR